MTLYRTTLWNDTVEQNSRMTSTKSYAAELYANCGSRTIYTLHSDECGSAKAVLRLLSLPMSNPESLRSIRKELLSRIN
jgi:hypothetical protein